MDSDLTRRAAPGTFAELWRVALPLVLSSGSLSLMHFMDRVFLTWYSTDALAASMPAGMLNWTVMSILIGTASYVNTFVAQYEGAGRKDRVAAAVWQGVYLSLTASLIIVFVAPFSVEIFALIGHAPAVQELEAEYFSVLCYGTIPVVMSSALASFYSGRGRTMTVMYVQFLQVGVTAVLDWGLIFGKGPFPQMGVTGAALATVLSYVAAVLCYVVLLSWSQTGREYRIWSNRRFDGQLFMRLMRYGLPTGLQWASDISAFTLFILLVGALGTEELAATNLAFSLNALAFIPMFGAGTAVMTLVGQRIGEGRPQLAVRTTWLAFRVSTAYMLAFAAAYVLLPDLMMRPFAQHVSAEEFGPLRDHAVVLLRFVALYSLFDGMAIVFGSACRGAGDTRFSLIFTVLSGWLLMVAPTAAAWWLYGGSLTVSWWAATVYIIVLGGGFLLRFQAGHWQSMRVIERDTIAEPVPFTEAPAMVPSPAGPAEPAPR